MTDNLNRPVALAYLGALYDGDIERAVACLHDDVDFLVYAPVEVLPHLGHRKGKDAVREMLQAIRHRYPDMRHEVVSVTAEQDRVATHIKVFFRKRANDRMVQMDLADFFDFRDQRITRIRHFVDSFDLVEQALEIDLTGLVFKDGP